MKTILYQNWKMSILTTTCTFIASCLLSDTSLVRFVQENKGQNKRLTSLLWQRIVDCRISHCFLKTVHLGRNRNQLGLKSHLLAKYAEFPIEHYRNRISVFNQLLYSVSNPISTICCSDSNLLMLQTDCEAADDDGWGGQQLDTLQTDHHYCSSYHQ